MPRFRDVPRLDCARDKKKKFGASVFKSKLFWDEMCCIGQKTWDIFATFRWRPVIRRPVYCVPLVPPLV